MIVFAIHLDKLCREVPHTAAKQEPSERLLECTNFGTFGLQAAEEVSRY